MRPCPNTNLASIDRRRFLQALGLGSAALAVGPALLSSCVTSVDDESNSSSSPGDPNATLGLHHDAGVGPLVQPYVDDFNNRYQPLKLTTAYVTSDYAATTNTQLAGGGVDYDVLFTDVGYTQLWHDNNWIADLSKFSEVQELVKPWSPGVLEECQDNNGALIALPYYRSIEIFLYNADLLAQINASTPNSWDELVEQCRELKSRGITGTPYSPFWTADFNMFWYEFVTEAFSDGAGPLFADNFKPLFQDDSVAAATLKRWATMYAEGLVPADIFTTSYGDVANIYAAGKSAYTIRYGPQAKGFRDPTQSRVHAVSRNGLIPGHARDTSDNGAYWCMTASSKNKPQAWTLLNYLAGKDKTSSYHVPKNLIALDLGLITPYAQVNDDPDVRNAWSKWSDINLLRAQITKSRSLGRVRQQPWYGDFMTQATAVLQDVVRGKKSPTEGLNSAADYVRSKL